MSMNRTIILISIFLFSATETVQSQDCRALLMKAVESMKKADGNRFAMEYTILTKLTDDSNQADQVQEELTSAKIYVADGKSRFESNEIELFKDNEIQIAVMKDEKEIILTSPLNPQAGKIKQEALTILQDSLLKWMTITDCETTCHAKDPNWPIEKIEAKLKTIQLQESTGIDRVLYWVDRKNNLVSRIQIFYSEHPYNVKEIDFNVFMFSSNFSREVFKGKAYNMVFVSGIEPVRKYKGYRVVDYRK
jgi:hypothetical protein